MNEMYQLFQVQTYKSGIVLNCENRNRCSETFMDKLLQRKCLHFSMFPLKITSTCSVGLPNLSSNSFLSFYQIQKSSRKLLKSQIWNNIAVTIEDKLRFSTLILRSANGVNKMSMANDDVRPTRCEQQEMFHLRLIKTRMSKAKFQSMITFISNSWFRDIEMENMFLFFYEKVFDVLRM